MVISNTAKEIGGVLLTLTLLATGVTVLAQNDSTGADLQVQGGSQTIYAGDGDNNNDICSADDIAATRTVEGVECDATQNSISLPNLFIKPNRQNPSTTFSDVIVEDLRGFQTANYTVTAEVSDFTSGGDTIALGTNPDGFSGRDQGEVTGIVVTNGGSGYTQAGTTVTISAPTGGGEATAVSATATPVIDGGVITGVTITNAGSGYQVGDNPTVTIAGDGSGGAARANYIPEDDNLSLGTVDSVVVDNGGAGYSEDVTVTIADPASGTAATAYPVIEGGVITEIIVLNSGAGYDATPNVTITDSTNTPATAATATATITAAGTSQDNLYVTLDPSNGTLTRLLPTSGDMNGFQTGSRTFVTSPTTQHTLFYTTTPVSTGRFEIDAVEFGLRVPAFVAAGTYTSTITQTVIN